MKYPDKKSYLHHTEVIARYLNKNAHKEPADLVGIISYFTGCPVIIVCQLLLDIKGESSELARITEIVTQFYHYE